MALGCRLFRWCFCDFDDEGFYEMKKYLFEHRYSPSDLILWMSFGIQMAYENWYAVGVFGVVAAISTIYSLHYNGKLREN